MARVSDFVRTPEGRYVIGRCWLGFCVQDGATGLVVWGAPPADEVLIALQTIAPEGSPLSQRRPRFIDLRRLAALDAGGLIPFASHMAANAARFAEINEQVALVHSGGFGLAIASGFSSLSSLPYDVRPFSDPVEALTWLGAREPARLAAELEGLHASALGMTPLQRDLRTVLDADLHGAELGMAARELGMSARSLQRKLRAEHTSFQRELDGVRVDAAKKRLVATAAPIATIAREVGYTSAHHFSTQFRKLTGHTPRQWRELGVPDGEPSPRRRRPVAR